MKHQKARRNPDGIEKARPIALRLMPDERANAERIAKKTGLTQSALARRAFLAGLPEAVKDLETA